MLLSLKTCFFYLLIGGSLGVVVVGFSVQNGTAILGEDFSESGGTVQFSSGQTTSFINITILDDSVPEQRDYFTVSLDSVTGGAKLASPKTVTITVETSDDPGGLFGFVNSSQLTLVNPSLSTDLSFVIQREGGAEGEVEVSGLFNAKSKHFLPRLHPENNPRHLLKISSEISETFQVRFL